MQYWVTKGNKKNQYQITIDRAGDTNFTPIIAYLVGNIRIANDQRWGAIAAGFGSGLLNVWARIKGLAGKWGTDLPTGHVKWGAKQIWLGPGEPLRLNLTMKFVIENGNGKTDVIDKVVTLMKLGSPIELSSLSNDEKETNKTYLIYKDWENYISDLGLNQEDTKMVKNKKGSLMADQILLQPREDITVKVGNILFITGAFIRITGVNFSETFDYLGYPVSANVDIIITTQKVLAANEIDKLFKIQVEEKEKKGQGNEELGNPSSRISPTNSGKKNIKKIVKKYLK